MRLLFFLLLTANAVFFIYHFAYKRPQQVSAPFVIPTNNDNIARLVLVEEAAPSALDNPASTAAAGSAADNGDQQTSVEDAAIDSATELAAPPIEVESETIATADVTIEQAAAQPAEPEEPPPPPPVCYTLGPVTTKLSADQLGKQLSAAEIGFELREDTTVDSIRHWVLIPPRKSKDAALTLLRELKRKKIDSFMITSGAQKNGISLGIFSEESSADRLAKRMRQRGYKVALDQLERTSTSFWIDLDSADGVKLTDPLWESLSQTVTKLKREQRTPCP